MQFHGQLAQKILDIFYMACIRECVRAGAAGSRTRRSLGHHLLHPLILRPRALFYSTDCTRRSKFLTHSLCMVSHAFLVAFIDKLYDM